MSSTILTNRYFYHSTETEAHQHSHSSWHTGLKQLVRCSRILTMETIYLNAFHQRQLLLARWAPESATRIQA